MSPSLLRPLFPSPPLHRHRQSSLFKILHIISVSSGEKNRYSSTDNLNRQNKGLNIDLNITLHLPTENETIEPPITPENVLDENRSSPITPENVSDENRSSPITPVETNPIGESDDVNTEISRDRSSGTESDEGCLGLLIEAAELILGEQESKSPAELGRKTERQEELWSEFGGRLPALKSKRGRNVVLPEKYRDSVVEPVVRWTSPETANGAILPVKRVRSKRRAKW